MQNLAEHTPRTYAQQPSKDKSSHRVVRSLCQPSEAKRLVHILSGRNDGHVAVARGQGIKVECFVLVWERRVRNNGLQGSSSSMTVTK
uniref:Uncharacterized protein n=1 Tax=Peronospora matthiolae TaxID=2874970 RepID=A0AAV1V5M3_9STRA